MELPNSVCLCDSRSRPLEQNILWTTRIFGGFPNPGLKVHFSLCDRHAEEHPGGMCRVVVVMGESLLGWQRTRPFQRGREGKERGAKSSGSTLELLSWFGGLPHPRAEACGLTPSLHPTGQGEFLGGDC